MLHVVTVTRGHAESYVKGQGSKSYTIDEIKLWNELPNEVQFIHQQHIFNVRIVIYPMKMKEYFSVFINLFFSLLFIFHYV